MFQNRILCVFCWAYFIFHQCLWFLLRQMIDYHIFNIFSKQQHLINRKMYHIANVNNGTHKPLLTIPNKIFLDFDIWPNIVCIPLHLHLLFLFIPLNWYWNLKIPFIFLFNQFIDWITIENTACKSESISPGVC